MENKQVVMKKLVLLVALCLAEGSKYLMECRRPLTVRHGFGRGPLYRRSTGGYPTSDVPPYLVTHWLPYPQQGSSEGRFVGNGVRINDTHYLGHLDTHAAVVNAKPVTHTPLDLVTRNTSDKFAALLFEDKADQPSFVHFGTPPKITNLMSEDDKEYQVGFKLAVKPSPVLSKQALAHSKIGLFEMTPLNKQGLTGSGSSDPGFLLPKLGSNPLATDPNTSKEDCNLLTWSQIKNEPSSRSGEIDPFRDLVTIPVKVESCEKNSCQLKTKDVFNDHVCDGFSDLGSPVYCGPNKKVTFIMNEAAADTHLRCNQEFNGAFVPSLWREITGPSKIG